MPLQAEWYVGSHRDRDVVCGQMVGWGWGAGGTCPYPPGLNTGEVTDHCMAPEGLFSSEQEPRGWRWRMEGQEPVRAH